MKTIVMQHYTKRVDLIIAAWNPDQNDYFWQKPIRLMHQATVRKLVFEQSKH